MDNYLILVEPGGELPAVGKTIYTKSALYDKADVIRVKRIEGLRWGKDNRLVVEVSGTFVREKYKNKEAN